MECYIIGFVFAHYASGVNDASATAIAVTGIAADATGVAAAAAGIAAAAAGIAAACIDAAAAGGTAAAGAGVATRDGSGSVHIGKMVGLYVVFRLPAHSTFP